VTRYLYSALLYLLAPLPFIKLWWRGRKLPAYRRRWGERLALFQRPPDKPRIWLHAVSVGETIAAAPLVNTLLERFPNHALLVTTTTPTGSEQVQRLFGNRVEHLYFPYDLPGVVRRFLDKTRPALLIVMETELWPNCFHHCRRRRIPIIIANARLSPSTFDGYRKIGWFIKQTLRDVSHIAAQSQADHQRFIQLGASPDKVRNIGNIKYDLTLDQGQIDAGRALRKTLGETRPVWIAASTHEGEETICIDAHKRLRKIFGNALLILVPRHPERFDAVAERCSAPGLTCKRRSRDERPDNDTAIYLADTMGELILLYAASDIAFVGGSFTPTGGHNPLEPAALGLPVVTGPTIHNFEAPYQALADKGAARILEEPPKLADTLIDWMQNDNERHLRGQKAMQLVEENRGAVEKIVDWVIAETPPYG